MPVSRLVDSVPHVLRVGTGTLVRLCFFTLPQNTYAELIPEKKTVAALINNSEKFETVTA